MFKKQPKLFYSLTPDERALVEAAGRQANLIQRGVQHFLGELAARERVPPKAVFHAGLMAFVPQPEEPEA